MATHPINPKLLDDYEEDPSIAEFIGPNSANVANSTNARNPPTTAVIRHSSPLAPVPPPRPPTATAEEIREEFRERVLCLRDFEPAAENDCEQHDDDPELDSDDVEKAFADYEKNLSTSQGDDHLENEEEYDEAVYPEDQETVEQMFECWNYHAAEYYLSNRPSERLFGNASSEETNLNHDAAEFQPGFFQN